ncbi:unnamed protein product [Ostreobium quekettii]|uniref:Uncharacterized protein n=1 Tax=Ostreobium quekettii TaxID=121088 RepID=A0A8S1IZC0_9CHLO|nr:unnamed protein product [Ostreobium quekettii]|eukprot:evm.model.scf_863.2 EVM.evm.TU.scf_863.2   scf_863:44958-45923(+)
MATPIGRQSRRPAHAIGFILSTLLLVASPLARAQDALTEPEIQILEFLQGSVNASSSQPSWVASIDATSAVSARVGGKLVVVSVITQKGETRRADRPDPPGGTDGYLLLNQTIQGVQGTGEDQRNVSFGWVLEVSTLGLDEADAWLRYSSVVPAVLGAVLPSDWQMATVFKDEGDTSFAGITEPYFSLDASVFKSSAVEEVIELDAAEIDGEESRVVWVKWRTRPKGAQAGEVANELQRAFNGSDAMPLPEDAKNSSSSVSWYWVGRDRGLVLRVEHKSTTPTAAGGSIDVDRTFAFSMYNETVTIPGPDAEERAAVNGEG